MGTYNLDSEDIKKDFLKFLKKTSDVQGDISATAIARAWNSIAKKNKWVDRLVAVGNIEELENPDKY